MKIHCFGDSWVHGIGTEWEPGRGKISMDERYEDDWEPIRNKYSWPGQLEELFENKVQVKNYGTAGNSNEDIYKSIINCIWDGSLRKGDLAIVSFSSIIRQPLSFLIIQDDYNKNCGNITGYINYSNSCFLHYRNGQQDDKLHWIETIEDTKIKKSTEAVYMDYIVNRFSYDFLYEISMQYICNLQIYFESLGVDYVFVNAFEDNISKNIKFYDSIKKEKWILFHYTLQEYLLDKSKDFDTSNGYSVWEDDFLENEPNQDGPHPNRIGYRMIAEFLYESIKNKKVIKNASFI
jgi:hypothetical protein